MSGSVLVVGTGLIGTSIALGLRDERDVLLQDPEPGAEATAIMRGAGRRWDGREQVDLAVVCAPPQLVGRALVELIRSGVATTYTHVASVQAAVQAEVEASFGSVSNLVGGHPMAGRERSGPSAAAGSLFAGRTWAICPTAGSDPTAISAVERLASSLGAHPVRMSPAEHDLAVAIVSHLPQLAASGLAAQLAGSDDRIAALAGPGLQDSTRIAASEPELWREIVRLNAGNLAPLVGALAADLGSLARSLEVLSASPAAGHSDQQRAAALDAVVDLLRRGAAGRALIPRKRGERDAAFRSVAVSVRDAPGQLAALLTSAGDGGVNVEDVRVDHVPDSPRGVIELLVRPAARDQAVQVLRAAGWDVLGEDPGLFLSS